MHQHRTTCLSIVLIVLATQVAVGDDTETLATAYREFALENPGRSQAGRELFENDSQLVCTNCHRITGMEKSGPNLDGIGDKYSREELITQILQPSASIKPGYEQVVILTDDGQTYTGRISRTTKQMYRLLDVEGNSTDIQRVDIAEFHALSTSLMPDNVASLVSKEQFVDLIAYLQSLKYSVVTGLEGPQQPVEITRLDTPIQLRPLHSPEQRFANPVWCGALPGQPGQLLVLEQQDARIWRLQPTSLGMQKHLFLDLGQDVTIGNNWGLMCIAFHPKFFENGRYFLKHEVSDSRVVKTVVVERTAASDRLRDSGRPSRRLLEQEQPAFNHNGGCIAFGPDGMLYAAFGDGGPQRDPNGYSQNPRIFHGSLLRIDVDHRDEGRPYAIPDDNPFLAAHVRDPSIRPETWAIGFREPWRFSFDPATGDLWLGDVGQDSFEEVCLVRRGENHGWNVFEAYEPFSNEFRQEGQTYVPPLFAYPHSFGVSVTGGFVYRGSRAPSFVGVYIFGDYETRRIWGLTQQEGRLTAVRELGEAPEHIASFGVDEEGEIYLVGYEGTIFQVDLSATKFE